MNQRVNDEYLINVLHLTPGFIQHHARAMGNRTKPRAYFLDTVIAYLRQREAEARSKHEIMSIGRKVSRADIIADFELARMQVKAHKPNKWREE